MSVIQKNHAPLQAKYLRAVEGGHILPKQFFLLDSDEHLVIPAPMGAIILKRGTFKLVDDGAFIANKYIVPAPNPNIVVIDGSITLVDPNGKSLMPNQLIPSVRVIAARERGVDKNLLIKAQGGVGDIICAEPAIRFALERFGNRTISLCTDYPEFFQHLKFTKVFPASGEGTPNYGKFLTYQNFTPGDELAWEFVSHPLVHAVDYASLNMWRAILPNSAKEITIRPLDEQKTSMRAKFPLGFFEHPIVVVHPGKTWDSRTFPKKWWDAVLAKLRAASIMPVIIGGEVDKLPDGTYRASTVEINTEGVLDMRGKLSFIETTALLQDSAVLLTNDSSPLHMAASGRAWIGFCSTVKDPSHLMHWRNGEFGWRMKNFTDGNLFSTIDFCPNQQKAIHVDELHINELLKWLPRPEDFATWAIGKAKPFDING